ncbi:MAG: hypothetical protein WA718_11345 [Terriglobales bacterium]
MNSKNFHAPEFFLVYGITCNHIASAAIAACGVLDVPTYDWVHGRRGNSFRAQIQRNGENDDNKENRRNRSHYSVPVRRVCFQAASAERATGGAL